MNKMLTVILTSFFAIFCSSVAYSDQIALDDVSLTYYNESGSKVTDIATWAEVGAWNPASTASFTNPYGTYEFILKYDGAGGVGSYGGSNFSLTSDLDKAGDFVLSWSGPAIPTYFDFVFGLGYGTPTSPVIDQNVAYYQFDQVYITDILPMTADGTYKMILLNPGGQIAGLSHFGLWGRTNSNVIPEPATMLLFGTGLAGLAAIGRRRKN